MNTVKHPLSQTFIPIAALAVTLLIGVLWTVPTVRDMVAEINEVELAEDSIASSLTPKRNTLLGTDSQELEEMNRVLRQVIPEETSPALSLLIVEHLAQQTGLETSKPSLVGINQRDQRSTVSIRLQGSLTEVESFFDLVTSTTPLLRVAKYQSDIIKAPEGENPAEYDVFVEVDAPYSPTAYVAADISRHVLPVLKAERDLIEELRARTNYSFVLLGNPDDVPDNNGKDNPFAQ